MSKQYPECPLFNHDTCRDMHNPKLCAIVRKDKNCLRELSKNVKRQKPVNTQFKREENVKENQEGEEATEEEPTKMA